MDGDGDGTPGGVNNFWFRVADTAHTMFVDKASTGGTGSLGSITNPYTSISIALATAGPDSVVRIVGNGGADKNLATVGDNLSYNIGFDSQGRTLSDGSKFEIPKDVTVMVDAGAIIKLHGANIDVGSSAQGMTAAAARCRCWAPPAKNAQASRHWHRLHHVVLQHRHRHRPEYGQGNPRFG